METMIVPHVLTSTEADAIFEAMRLLENKYGETPMYQTLKTLREDWFNKR